jgi:GT2 family glycosyltransferase
VSRVRKVSVLVLSWNGRRHLEECLPALRDQQSPGCEHETLVLDNGSTDGTGAWVRETHPEVRLLESRVNLGFCTGNNRLAAEASGDALVFLNNDTRPRRDWLAALTAALDDAPEDVAAVSGLIVDWQGERLDFASGIMTFDGHAFQMDQGRPLAEADLPAAGSEMLFACGGNMIIRRRSFLDAGGFDPDYFAYLEDVDLGWRLWSGGERVLFTPDAVVHHRSMATSQELGVFNRGFLFERNAFLTAYKNYQDGWWEKLMPAVLLTLVHRTQTLLVENNLGTEILALDPYAGMLANTATGKPPVLRRAPAPAAESLSEKWRRYGGRDLLRRGLRKAVRSILPSFILDDGSAHVPRLVDERTIAQFRAIHHLLANLDGAAASRRRVQARRKRGDREIFERFPLALVPTYPGDEELFDGPAFASWLDEELPILRLELDDVLG